MKFQNEADAHELVVLAGVGAFTGTTRFLKALRHQLYKWIIRINEELDRRDAQQKIEEQEA